MGWAGGEESLAQVRSLVQCRGVIAPAGHTSTWTVLPLLPQSFCSAAGRVEPSAATHAIINRSRPMSPHSMPFAM